ncbi:hypothetical protein GCM10015535_66870 [Streptomyces gelaticus]|uniref:Uncharacterized protein n=1 Tax=Streptomyces gelaticus TaxID=285446 RepID=A0ABQ2W8R1_9ACTN|nr:hypothetical protein GCM10015535_66870 [Streptomyces gelaticus]
MRRKGMDGGGERVAGGNGAVADRQVHEHHVAGGPFDEGADGRAAVLADDESGSGDALLRPRPLKTVQAAFGFIEQ